MGLAPFRAELHCHSTASDGTLIPEDLVSLAVQKGLRALAITDHDTTAAFAPACRAAAPHGLDVVPALEINAEEAGQDVHILGYYVDPDRPALQQALVGLRQARVRRLGEILQRLRDLDVPVREERVLELAGGDSVGRPHVARALVEAGHATDVATAFDLFLGTGRPAFVPRRNLRPCQAVHLIREAGGVAVLAHPGPMVDEELVLALVAEGLQGLEVYHPLHSMPVRQRLEDLALRLGLLVTGGSDYHGPERYHLVDFGEVALPADTLGRLRRAAGRCHAGDR